MSFDQPYPSHDEATALANLASLDLHDRSPLPTEVLPKLVRLCQRDDVRNFLFTSEPIHLSYLTNPRVVNDAITGRVTVTRVENNRTRFFSNHLQSSFFLTPVFSSDHFSFGFGVQEHVFTPAILWNTSASGIFGRSVSRFVSDKESSVVIHALNFPEYGLVHIDFTQAISSTLQRYYFIRFRRDQLQAAYETDNFDVEHLMNAVDTIQTSLEFRDCPICRLSHTGCTCTISLAKPQHPFDVSAFRANMKQRLGTFHGVAAISMYESGLRTLTARAGSRRQIQVGNEVRLIERLRKLAIGESLKVEDPRHSLIADADEYCNTILDAESNDQGLAIAPCSHEHSPLEALPMPSSLDLLVQPDMPVPQGSNEVGLALLLPSPPIDKGRESDFVSSGGGQGHSERETFIPSKRIESEGQSASDTATRPAVAPLSTKSDDKLRDTMRLLRAKMREERNRASAQRSNLRKKAEHDAKKFEIKRNKEKAAQLRSQEITLRQENVKLREQLKVQRVQEQE